MTALYTLSGTQLDSGLAPIADALVSVRLCDVNANVEDSLGRPVSDYYIDGQVASLAVSTTTDSAGVWSVQVPSNLDGTLNRRMLVSIRSASDNRLLELRAVQMPQLNCSLSTLVAAETIDVSAAYLGNLLDVDTAGSAARSVLRYDGSEWLAAALEADDIQSGTFAPALISEASVTQHQGAIEITESQISDLRTYALESDVSDALALLGTASGYDAGTGAGEVLLLDVSGLAALGSIPDLPASRVTSGAFGDARISATSVRQHLSAGDGLSLTGGRFDLDIDSLPVATLDRSVDYVPIYDDDGVAAAKVLASSFGNDLSALSGSLWPTSDSLYDLGSASKHWATGHLDDLSIGQVGAEVRLYGAADVLSQRNGTTAQAQHLYGTYTDAANYERWVTRFNGTQWEIGPEWAGSGSSKNILIRTGNSSRKLKIDLNGDITGVGYTPKFNGNTAGTHSGNVNYFGGNNGQLTIDGSATTGVAIGAQLMLSGRDESTYHGAFVLSGAQHIADRATPESAIKGVSAYASAVTYLDGGDLSLAGGDGYSTGNGGNVTIAGGAAYGTGAAGDVVLNGGNRAAKINDPSSGTTVDTEARVAIVALIDALEAHGLAAAA